MPELNEQAVKMRNEFLRIHAAEHFPQTTDAVKAGNGGRRRLSVRDLTEPARQRRGGHRDDGRSSSVCT